MTMTRLEFKSYVGFVVGKQRQTQVSAKTFCLLGVNETCIALFGTTLRPSGN